jgi:hypothetical protein
MDGSVVCMNKKVLMPHEYPYFLCMKTLLISQFEVTKSSPNLTLGTRRVADTPETGYLAMQPSCNVLALVSKQSFHERAEGVADQRKSSL